MSVLNISFLSICFFTTAYGRYRNLEIERTILSDMFESYDKRIRPTGINDTGPVIVEVNTYIRSINNIDDVNMVYDIQLTFRQSWVDDRLRYTNKDIDYVILTNPNQLWIPDVFFSNEQSGHFHNMLLPNILIRIFPDGRILYSTRISLHLFCSMNLENYPLDNQVCNIIAASYGYTSKDVEFVWKSMGPVQVTKSLMLSKFELVSIETDNCNTKTNTGEYSCLKLKLFFSRDFFYYMVQVYMPLISMVLLSWLVFWINPTYSTVRFGILVGLLISSVLITTSINNRAPQVSYIKAIDVWIGVCMCFIFCAMLELCLVVKAIASEDRMRLKNQLATEEEKNYLRLEECDRSNQMRKFSTVPLKWLNKYSTYAQRIDAVSRFIFPVAFAIFNTVYWLKYAVAREITSH